MIFVVFYVASFVTSTIKLQVVHLEGLVVLEVANYKACIRDSFFNVRHLASGDKYPTLQYDFRVARNTMSVFIPEVCHAIVDEYKHEAIIILSYNTR
jgi:hypothetical protein